VLPRLMCTMAQLITTKMGKVWLELLPLYLNNYLIIIFIFLSWKLKEKPIVGTKNRNDVGILFWDPKEENNARTEVIKTYLEIYRVFFFNFFGYKKVGSMLKTPKYPIWLAIMGKNQLAILFNTNIDLMNNWRLEQIFTLHFYSALRKQETQITLTIGNYI